MQAVSLADVLCSQQGAIWDVDVGPVNVAEVVKEVDVHEMVVALQVVRLQATVFVLRYMPPSFSGAAHMANKCVSRALERKGERPTVR